jgi:hypothetical protein
MHVLIMLLQVGNCVVVGIRYRQGQWSCAAHALQVEQCAGAISAAKEEKELADTLQRTFGRGGLQHMVMNNAVQELERYANRLLKILSPEFVLSLQMVSVRLFKLTHAAQAPVPQTAEL